LVARLRYYSLRLCRLMCGGGCAPPNQLCTMGYALGPVFEELS
jgi:hypothetical protein